MSAPVCALGFRVKSGWAAAVLIANSRNGLTVIDSGVVELADPAVPSSRQPYHAGFGTAEVDTAKVARLVSGVEHFARRSVAALLARYRKDHRIRSAGVVTASLTDPATISNQHMRAHASEGRLFRTVLTDALEQCDVRSRVILERGIYELLAKALGISASQAKRKIAALGESITPWRAEQKVAAAAAWLVLAG